ncbi:PREDICTED: centromere protein I [Thamnophis sirtalis]|uniref:Centromere protein I n=1 Tax=Thamnophis sirtalis TaxID=35019 RepID=A0A6I9XUW7_9SAUR|nr:PREDICTED: centromere protein I [Thamnophis sirtalis]
MKRVAAAKKQKNIPISSSKQTGISTWIANGSKSTQEHKDHETPSNEETDCTQDPLEEALVFLTKIKDRTSLKNEALQKHLLSVEKIAQERGLTPEEIDALLNIALSGKFAEVINTRLLKNLIPISTITEDSIVSAVSWLCVGKCSRNTQVLFLKWLIAMYDLIDHKEKVNALYGFFFNFLQDEKLCPFVCHVLYLLTKRENVKPFRVRRLLDLRSKMGSEAPLQALLLMYKSFAPSMVASNVFQSTKMQFKNSENQWKTAIGNIKQRIYGISPTSQPVLAFQPPKKKWNSKLMIPESNSNSDYLAQSSTANCIDFNSHPEFFPVQHLQTFSQLLENIHCLELPSQIGSVLGNHLLLHYVNCVTDDVVYQRMYYWLGQTFREECPWTKIENQKYELEFKEFLDTVLEAECFLQEGFSSCEEFLYRSLPFWDGCCCRSQVLQMISWIPLSSFSEMKPYLCKPLTQLFFTSSLYFKCSVLESLRELLLNWLNWHFLQADMAAELNAGVLNTSVSSLVNSITELIHFVGRLSTIALHLENNSAFLMHFVLDFYEIVCDMFQKYQIPLLVIPPAGVFYPALLSMDSVTVDQLCHIMFRYRTNLIAAKKYLQSKKASLQIKFNRQICQEYNQYITSMVGCLWTSNVFQMDSHPQGIYMEPGVLEKTSVQEYRKALNIVYHPAFTGYAILFMQQIQSEHKIPDIKLIQGKRWDWYLEYLYSQELQGLKVFIESSISRVFRPSQTKPGNYQ